MILNGGNDGNDITFQDLGFGALRTHLTPQSSEVSMETLSFAKIRKTAIG